MYSEISVSQTSSAKSPVLIKLHYIFKSAFGGLGLTLYAGQFLSVLIAFFLLIFKRVALKTRLLGLVVHECHQRSVLSIIGTAVDA